MKKYIVSLAIVALALCACNRVEMHDVIADGGATVYQLDLRLGFSPRTRAVSFDGDGVTISTQFQETDCIYIYNETKGAFARTKTDEIHAPLIALHPHNISGAFCDLSGSLSFYVWNSGLNEWIDVAVEDGDKYSLFYQMNRPSEGSSMNPLFDYSDQDGSATSASVHDFAVATDVTMAKTVTTLSAPEGVLLENLQSMFRLRLSYTDEDSAPIAAPSIASMSVSTKNGTLVYWYKPTDTGDEYDLDLIPLDTPVVFSENNDIYLSLAFHYDSTHSATDDELILTASDGTDAYKGTIAVPSGGFVNSNYYYGELTMVKQAEEPSFGVYRKEGDNLIRVALDEPRKYTISIPNGIEYVFKGSCSGYAFELEDNAATIILTGNEDPVSASYFGTYDFIQSDEDLTIVLDCNYVINCPNCVTAIWSSDNLRFKTTGGSHTLTVNVKNNTAYYGIYGDSNFDAYLYCIEDVQLLADEGFSVSYEGPTNNNDGTIKWVYTVTPNP